LHDPFKEPDPTKPKTEGNQQKTGRPVAQMPPDETTLMADRKKFMLKVAEYFVPSKHLRKINDINEMFRKHRKKRRKIDHEPGPADPRHPIPAAKADHHPMEGGFIRFKPALTSD